MPKRSQPDAQPAIVLVSTCKVLTSSVCSCVLQLRNHRPGCSSRRHFYTATIKGTAREHDGLQQSHTVTANCTHKSRTDGEPSCSNSVSIVSRRRQSSRWQVSLRDGGCNSCELCNTFTLFVWSCCGAPHFLPKTAFTQLYALADVLVN